MKNDYELICNDFTVCPENWGMRSEAATFHRIYYVYSGEGYCVYKEEAIRFQPGHLYLFPVMSPYTMWHNPLDPLKVLWFHVETEKPLCAGVRDLTIQPGNVLELLLQTLKALTGKPAYFQELVDTVGVFLHILSQEMVMDTGDSRQMQDIVRYIDENVSSTSLSVDTLAREMGMDRASFSRKFKRVFSLSPGHYIYQKKMNCAAMELAQGATVYEAACKAGYLDEKSFSRAFKRYTAAPPSEYRRKRAIMP